MKSPTQTILQRCILLLLPLLALEVGLRVAGIGGSVVYEENPIYGYRPRPNQRFSTMGHPIRILENGFRAPRGTNGWLVVGDSVAYGTAYVRDEETVAALLGADNAGVNGWGPLNIARFLGAFDCAAYRGIIWVFPSCDVMRPFMTLRAGLISTNRRMWFRTEYLLRFLWFGHLRPTVQPNDPGAVAANWEAIRETHMQLAAGGCRMLLVFLSAREECAGGETPDTAHFKDLIVRAGESGLDFIVAQPSGDCDVLYRDTAHLTAEGNRWLAGVIAAELAARNW